MMGMSQILEIAELLDKYNMIGTFYVPMRKRLIFFHEHNIVKEIANKPTISSMKKIVQISHIKKNRKYSSVLMI